MGRLLVFELFINGFSMIGGSEVQQWMGRRMRKIFINMLVCQKVRSVSPSGESLLTKSNCWFCHQTMGIGKADPVF